MNMDTGLLSSRVRPLRDGNSMPVIGLGLWQVENGRDAVDAVLSALSVGYRHFDTAQAYANEESVGRALRLSGIHREQVFITTKFNPSNRDPLVELERSLQRLGLDYVDLYLVHWPARGPLWAWHAMERARESGIARSIGVSNFSATELQQLANVATVAPVVDQVQLSPFSYRRSLLKDGKSANLVFEAYSPLGTGRYLSNETVNRVAARLGRTPAQVLVRWALQRDLVVLTKSTQPDHIAENAQVFDFVLEDPDMAELDALDTTGGTSQALERKWW